MAYQLLKSFRKINSLRSKGQLPNSAKVGAERNEKKKEKEASNILFYILWNISAKAKAMI